MDNKWNSWLAMWWVPSFLERPLHRFSPFQLFRHGDRTPIATFPTDPYREADWPNGWVDPPPSLLILIPTVWSRFGQLTTAGIEQHHRLGRYLRSRYGSLLNSNYTASEILVRSTDYDRTLMSAQSNLIGLYPVNNATAEDRVPIQPIPIHTVPMNEDFVRWFKTSDVDGSLCLFPMI